MTSARVIRVIVTESREGLGKEGDPVRIVTRYWSLSGKFLAEVDPVITEHLARIATMKEGRIQQAPGMVRQ